MPIPRVRTLGINALMSVRVGTDHCRHCFCAPHGLFLNLDRSGAKTAKLLCGSYHQRVLSPLTDQASLFFGKRGVQARRKCAEGTAQRPLLAQ